MKNATKITASTFGAIMALAGIEHGIGEILQGSTAPEGIMILSWPESEFFHSLGGEPAMTVIPNLLVTGLLAVLVSLALLIWSVLFVQRKNGGWVMIVLSIVMLLVGGGIFPPIFGVLIGIVATRIHALHSSPKARQLDGFQHFLAKLWPWSYTACIIAWLSVVPVAYFSGMDNIAPILVVLFFALGTLGLTVFSAFAYDARVQAGAQPAPQDTGGLKGQGSLKKAAHV